MPCWSQVDSVGDVAELVFEKGPQLCGEAVSMTMLYELACLVLWDCRRRQVVGARAFQPNRAACNYYTGNEARPPASGQVTNTVV